MWMSKTRRSARRLVVSGALMAVLALLIACAHQPAPSLDDLMATYFAAKGTSSLDRSIQALVTSGASVEETAALLRAGRTYSSDVARGWSVSMIESMDGADRPYHVYVPEYYDPAQAHPAIVYLHGGVGLPRSVEDLIPSRAIWEAAAAREGFLLILPHGDAQAPWWSAVGLANIHVALGEAKKLLNVDENRIFLTGFSDGGSGAYWMAMQDPTPWAGFLSYYGDPSVGSGGSYHCYPRNLVNRPLRAVNGTDDQLYPAREMRLYVDQLEDLGVYIEWEAYPTGHDFDFFAQEEARSLEFIASTVRDPFPSHVAWETANPAVGRCDWVQIDEIDDVGNNSGISDVNLLYRSAQILLGVIIETYKEEGALVAEVIPGFVAYDAGVQAGDRLIAVNDRAITSSEDIQNAMENRQPGDVIYITLGRGDQELALSAAVPEPFPVYPRLMTAAAIDVVADGNRIDVRVRNVARYTLYISSAQFDLGQSIEVITNGQTSFSDTVNPSIRFMLEQAAQDIDRQAIYEAKLQITVEPAGS